MGAISTDTPGAVEPVLSPEEERLVERLAREVTTRRMTVPAILFLESMKPLTFLGSQWLRFFEPMVRAVVDRAEYGTAAGLFEDRDKVEILLQRIEALEASGAAVATTSASAPRETRE